MQAHTSQKQPNNFSEIVHTEAYFGRQFEGEIMRTTPTTLLEILLYLYQRSIEKLHKYTSAARILQIKVLHCRNFDPKYPKMTFKM